MSRVRLANEAEVPALATLLARAAGVTALIGIERPAEALLPVRFASVVPGQGGHVNTDGLTFTTTLVPLPFGPRRWKLAAGGSCH